MKNDSSIGDWLFVVGGIVAIGAYMGYENQAIILAWIQAWPAPSVVANVTSGGILAMLTQYWGIALFAGVLGMMLIKSLLAASPASGTDGDGIDYSSPAWVDVTLIE